MRRFEIYSGNLRVGWSELESADHSMAVAFGRFIPAEGYAAIQNAVMAARQQEQSGLALSIRLDGDALPCEVVHIADYSDITAADGIEVSAYSLQAFAELFPNDAGV